MKLSKEIEEFLKVMLADADGTLEIQRNELAGRFNCVPSQITYVISTRFTNECGYHVESRRGGGGYIKITRVAVGNDFLMHTINCIGDKLDWQSTLAIIGNCADYEAVTHREGKIMLAALSDNSLIAVDQPDRDKLRAKVLKTILANLAIERKM